jgi:hypothetical protein
LRRKRLASQCDFLRRRLTDEVKRVRRQLGVRRPRDLDIVRGQTRERVRRFRERQKEALAERQNDRRKVIYAEAPCRC